MPSSSSGAAASGGGHEKDPTDTCLVNQSSLMMMMPPQQQQQNRNKLCGSLPNYLDDEDQLQLTDCNHPGEFAGCSSCLPLWLDHTVPGTLIGTTFSRSLSLTPSLPTGCPSSLRCTRRNTPAERRLVRPTGVCDCGHGQSTGCCNDK